LNNLVIAVIVNNAFARAEQAKSLALWTGLNWIELRVTNIEMGKTPVVQTFFWWQMVLNVF
jgi:hypothetical protein